MVGGMFGPGNLSRRLEQGVNIFSNAGRNLGLKDWMDFVRMELTSTLTSAQVKERDVSVGECPAGRERGKGRKWK